jgi:hypothetical protein
VNEKVATATLTVVSAGAGLSLILPSADTAADASPGDGGFRARLNGSAAVYAVAVVSLGLLQANAAGSALPVVAAVALVALVWGTLEGHRRAGRDDGDHY